MQFSLRHPHQNEQPWMNAGFKNTNRQKTYDNHVLDMPDYCEGAQNSSWDGRNCKDEIVRTSVQVPHHSYHYGRDTKRKKIFTRGQQNTQDVPTSPGRVIPTKKRWMGVPPGQKAKASRDKSGEVVLNVLNRSSGVVRCQLLLENGLFVAYWFKD